MLRLAHQILHLSFSLFVLGLLVVIATFAVANRAPVTVSLWPFQDFQLPLYVAVLGAAGFGMLAGGAICWFGKGRLWLRARASERRAERLQQAVERAPAAQPAPAVPALPAAPALGPRARAAVHDG